MGIVFRQSIKTTIVIFLGALLGTLVIYLSTKLIPKQEYGFTRNLTNQALVFGQILMVGLHGTLAVFIHRYDNDARKRTTLIAISLLIPGLLVLLFSAFYFMFSNWILHHFQAQDIPFMKRYFAWMPLFALFFIYQIILEQYLTSQLKVALATFLREVVLRILNIIFIILFGLYYISFDVLVASTVLVYLVPILLQLYFAAKIKGFGLSLDRHAFSKAEYKEIIHFSWYHALLGISLNLLVYLDTLMLAPLSSNGLSDVAVYGVAVFIISVLQIPYKAMMTSTFPMLTRAFRDNDHDKVKDVFIRSCINILIASTLVAALIFCNMQNAVAVIKKGYEEIIPLVLILMIGRMVDIATGMNDQLLSVSKYYKANFYFSLVLVLVMVVLYRIFIPKYGIYGAAWSTTLSVTLYNIAKYVYVWKKLKLQPFSINTISVLLAGIIAIAIGWVLPFMHDPYTDTFLRSMAIIITYVLIILWLKPSKDVQEYISSVRTHRRFF